MKTLLKKFIPAQVWNALRHAFYKSRARARALYLKRIAHDYSQAGETVLIRSLLQKSKGTKRFFIELGANDGITVSSTLGLIKDGWYGVAVEANPIVFARLQRNWKDFSKVKVVCMAVAPKRGLVKLYLGKNDPKGVFSTISTENSVWFERVRSESFVEVPGVPLTELLEESGVPQYPDLLLVDTEGMDYDVLLTLDFLKYRPKLIVTEDYQPKNAAKFELLERMGYTFVKRVGCNTFWLNSR